MRQTISIEIDRYRTNHHDTVWDLPAWGHPLSQGVMPLFIQVSDHLFPIGTAFTTGPVSFVVSALHNVREALKHEGRLAHLVGRSNIPNSITLKDVGLSILHQRWKDDSKTKCEISIWPIETFDGLPPTDLVFGFPQFQQSFPTLGVPISFELPTVGADVWSIGYHTVRCPADGIPLDQVRAGTFDWGNSYAHRLIVVRGTVERIFVSKFSNGYVEGPCFAFSGEILHQQSGGPIISTSGAICGVNAAGATTFFGRPTSLASLFFPALLTSLRSGIDFASNFRFNATQPLLNWVTSGGVRSDGSEERLRFIQVDGRNDLIVLPAISTDIAPDVFLDFAAWQRGESIPLTSTFIKPEQA